MSEDKMSVVEVDRVRSLLGQMSSVCAEIERRKAAYVELARDNETCRGCGQPPQDIVWVLIPTPDVGLVEKLLCQCEQGHEWYATIPWPEEKKS